MVSNTAVGLIERARLRYWIWQTRHPGLDLLIWVSLTVAFFASMPLWVNWLAVFL